MINVVIQTDNSSNALRRLNKIIGWCIVVLFTLCVLILAFAVQQILIARGTEKRAEVVNCKLVLDDLNGKIRKLELKVTELESEKRAEVVNCKLVVDDLNGKIRKLQLKVTERESGPSVGTIEKGKKAAFQGDAESLLQPYHSAITASNKDNFNDANITDRSSSNHVID